MNTEILLFSVKTDAKHLLSKSLNINMQVNAHDHMTTKEFEEFKELISEAVDIVCIALLRRVSNSDDE